MTGGHGGEPRRGEIVSTGLLLCHGGPVLVGIGRLGLGPHETDMRQASFTSLLCADRVNNGQLAHPLYRAVNSNHDGEHDD